MCVCVIGKLVLDPKSILKKEMCVSEKEREKVVNEVDSFDWGEEDEECKKE